MDPLDGVGNDTADPDDCAGIHLRPITEGKHATIVVGDHRVVVDLDAKGGETFGGGARALLTHRQQEAG